MLRCRTSSGSIATREAPLGYERVHLVGRRPVKAICRSSGCVCQSTENSLHLSLASVWELQIKMQLGKLALRLPLADVLRDQQQQNGLVLA
jgi:hypothetical protein